MENLFFIPNSFWSTSVVFHASHRTTEIESEKFKIKFSEGTVNNEKIVLYFIIFIIFFSVTNSNATNTMKAEFPSLQSCLFAIEKSSGQKLKIITDKPDEVSGFLANGKGFACQKKVTGTKGTYFEGWYMLD
ncbi:MAG: hypothetical protein RBS95_03875 [Desulfobulbus sp.]|nr:hypothetical protein [Desulfobulbus sp.]